MNTPLTDIYLDMMEKTLSCYTTRQLEQRVQHNGVDYLDLQSYSRITCVLGCLIAGGRMTERQPLWEQMMTACCEEIPTFRSDIVADFSIKDIMLAYKLMKNRCDEALSQRWKLELGKLDPYVHYGSVARNEEWLPKLHNINVYNMAGEYLRETEGLTDTSAYFNRHWPEQLSRFDANGMYRDPGNPVLYDLTTRCQIQLLIGFGYRGPYFREIDDNLRRGGLMTLKLQSATGEFPYGGRSNQFLFNEGLIAANAEYEALRYKAEGNIHQAGIFKRAARLAVESISRWLEDNPARHIKNRYPIESGYGTESYGYYDKYMITLGSFLAIAYCFADDSIEESPCPAETGDYVVQTTDDFHKVIANASGYSIQIDIAADSRYDATGLGRLHRAGVPSELGLSTPLSAGAGFKLREDVQRVAAAIGPGWRQADGTIRYLSECAEKVTCEVDIIEENVDRVRFALTYRGEDINGCLAIKETYELGVNGLIWTCELLNPEREELYIRVPVLLTNGFDHTSVQFEESQIIVRLNDYSYRVAYQGEATFDSASYGNRNGEYGLAVIRAASTTTTLRLALTSPHLAD